MTGQGDEPADGPNWPRLILRVGAIFLAVYLLHLLIDWATAQAEAVGNMPLMLGLMLLLLVTYTILMAIPFAPGIEIGISLLILKGAAIAPFVFLATVMGLALAFLAGRFIPYAWLHAILYDLRLMSACALLERIAPLDQEARLSLLKDRLPPRLHPLAGGGRYVLVALLLNLPGNALIGGGGGIAFIAGLSRLYPTGPTPLVMTLAVLPVPMAVWLYGADILPEN